MTIFFLTEIMASIVHRATTIGQVSEEFLKG